MHCNTDKGERLVQMNDFYRTWTERLPSLSDGYIYDENGTLQSTRFTFQHLKKSLKNFVRGELNENEKILLLPGIRGVGKTTLLMQLYNVEKIARIENDTELMKAISLIDERLYIDVAKLSLEGIALNEFFKFYEYIRGLHFEKLKRKCLLLIDEIHYDSKWGLFLKTLFDRTAGHKNILIIATGSSALQLRMNPDLSRRTSTIEMYPLSFTEYMMLKHSNPPSKNIGNELFTIVFKSRNPRELYSNALELSTSVQRYFSTIPSNALPDFLEIGGFPFTLSMTNKIKSIELIKNVIDSMIIKDVVTLKKFNTQSINKINQLLYLIANSDKISYEKLQQSLRIPEFRTIDSLIEVLEQAGILLRINSYGKGYGSTRKTPKFLFISPSLRTGIIDNRYTSAIEGKKLEDYFVLLYRNRLKSELSAKLSYDIARGGADFILSMRDTLNIMIEVGFNKESVDQLKTTDKKIKSGYGIVFGSKSIEIIDDTYVKLPLEYFLLL